MISEIIHQGPWQIPVKATNVLCPDGKYRTIRLHTVGGADTAFTIPGQCQVRGKTVTGFISHSSQINTEDEEMYFWPRSNNFGAFFHTYDEALKFVMERIVPNKQINEFSMRDVIKFSWWLNFTRDLKNDWHGDAWNIKGYDRSKWNTNRETIHFPDREI